jgi:hypothetical protein
VTRRVDCGQCPTKHSHGRKGKKNGKKTKLNMVSIPHHNVQSINNKLLELNVLL